MQAAWEGVERESLQDLVRWLKEVSAHLQEVQEKVNNLPQQVGKAKVHLFLKIQALAWLELAWCPQVAMSSHLRRLHFPYFR